MSTSSNDPTPPPPPPPYLISTSSLLTTTTTTSPSLTPRAHRFNPSAHRSQSNISDSTSLTKSIVHLCRLPPNSESTAMHWHTCDDEWVYVVEAGEGARVVVVELDEVAQVEEGEEGVKGKEAKGEAKGEGEGGKGEIKTKEIPIHKGDFLGFPAGARIGRLLKSGPTEVVYLMGGSRESFDVCHYPLLGRRLVIDRTAGGSGWKGWSVLDGDVVEWNK
ncbi:hypothetical protein JAAARDRAFT_39063 [Jaapia argillacea MUCL 33604]|uniref:Uncharacterized protein n=1 Tax=Jaapia argillacea MUCL 33604 TaxID=933084 RepID=A0A067PR11_9AGAM|nr:hypothetical protein JAAARDRAFT_39063 [Jaapia argillacea MUCL 33604]